MMPHYLTRGKFKKLVLPYGHQCVGVLPTYAPDNPKYFVVAIDEGEEVYYVSVETLECKAAHRINSEPF